MAVNKRSGQVLMHFLARFAGLTSLLLSVAALVVWFLTGSFLWLTVAFITAVVVLLAMIIEVRLAAKSVMSRRGALGSTVALQTVLAISLLLLINLFSYSHHIRWDLTRERLFTMSPSIQAKLAKLRDDTTIVLHLRHVTFGQRTEKMDNFDAAAERKVVDKVRDFVEQFQQLGAKFKVHTLDIQHEDYKQQLDKLTKDRRSLRDAIDRSTENAIFFYSDGDVGKLRFSDIYQLDKRSSQKRGNLVLRPQGIQSFTDHLLNIDRKKPRVTIAVTDAMFGMESDDEVLSMSAVKDVLKANGFDPDEVILHRFEVKQTRLGPKAAVIPAALTHDEDRYPALEKKIATFKDLSKDLTEQIKEHEEEGEFLKDLFSKPLAEVNKEWGVVLLGPFLGPLMKRSENDNLAPVTDEIRTLVLAKQRRIQSTDEDRLARVEDRLKQAKDEMAKLDIEDLEETRRISDPAAKLSRLLENTDLLILPRHTYHDLNRGFAVMQWWYNLESAQVEPIRDYLKQGKPALFLLGPSNVPDDPRRRPIGGPDQLENLLGELHFRLPEQMIVYDAETERLESRGPDRLGRRTQVKIPPVEFTSSEDLLVAGSNKPHPIETSMRLFSYDLDDDLQLRLRHARPVFYGKKLDKDQSAAVFMMTDQESWSESEPLAPLSEARFDAPKLTTGMADPRKIEQRGPIPIGVAVEAELPGFWYDVLPKKPTTARIAVIGHGGVFTGQDLSPVQEKLFLDVVNWLVGRNELLTSDAETWEYPRADLTSRQVDLWKWGIALGLPLLCVYSGFVVLLIRRMR